MNRSLGIGKVAELKAECQPGLPGGFTPLGNEILLPSVITVVGGENLLTPSRQSERPAKPALCDTQLRELQVHAVLELFIMKK